MFISDWKIDVDTKTVKTRLREAFDKQKIPA